MLLKQHGNSPSSPVCRVPSTSSLLSWFIPCPSLERDFKAEDQHFLLRLKRTRGCFIGKLCLLTLHQYVEGLVYGQYMHGVSDRWARTSLGQEKGASSPHHNTGSLQESFFLSEEGERC